MPFEGRIYDIGFDIDTIVDIYRQPTGHKRDFILSVIDLWYFDLPGELFCVDIYDIILTHNVDLTFIDKYDENARQHLKSTR